MHTAGSTGGIAGTMDAKAIPANALAAWLKTALEERGWSQVKFLQRSGLSKSTLRRFLDPHHLGSFELDNLLKAQRALGVPLPPEITGEAPGYAPEGMQEPELRFLRDTDAALQPFERTNNQGVWEVNNHLLQFAGYLPGDHVLVDMGITPRDGDVVCAQLVDQQRGSAETVIRIYQPPHLLTATAERGEHTRVLYVDNVRVKIMGTVVLMQRQRR